MKTKRIHVTMTEARIVEEFVKKGFHISDHQADAYLAMMNHVDPANWYQNEPPDKTARKVILSGLKWPERPMAIKHMQRKDSYIASGGLMHMHDVTDPMHDDNTYRISVFPDGVDVVCFGLESVDSQLEGHYDRIDDLPDWVKERLAVLNMMSPSPPTNSVDGVGRRISAHVYWVFAPSASTSA